MSSRTDSSLFFLYERTSILIVLVYVDDILITRSSASQVSKLITDLPNTFALRDLGVLSYFLGVEATYSNDAIHFSQSKYRANLLAKTDMSDCKPTKTPSTIGKSISQYDGEPFEDVTLYRSMVGALQYVTMTRPDVSFAINKACQFMHQPTTSH
ncbi:hypothetical protein UlMin_000218 [Ulmus minor]